MMTLRALHQRISSVPNLLVNRDCLFPDSNQSITQATIIESGTIPPSVVRVEMRSSQLLWADPLTTQLVQTSRVDRQVRVPRGVDHPLAKYALLVSSGSVLSQFTSVVSRNTALERHARRMNCPFRRFTPIFDQTVCNPSTIKSYYQKARPRLSIYCPAPTK
jgi:hypothetical protein